MAVKAPDLPERGVYPWAKWSNGDAWVATQGVDFEGEPFAFRRYVILVARRLSQKAEKQNPPKKVSVKTRVRENTVWFQFTTERRKKS